MNLPNPAARLSLLCLLLLPFTGHAQQRDSLLQQGYTFLAAESYAKAQGTFEQLLQYNRRDLEARIGLGQAYFHQAKYTQAQSQFDAVRYRQQADPRSYYWLGRVAFEQRDYAEAYDRLKTTFGKDSLQLGLHHYMGASAFHSGRDSVAYHHLQLAELEPVRPAYTQYYLGRVLLAYDYYVPAQEAFEQALELDGRIPRFYVGLGDLHHELGDYHRAAFYYQEATRRNPNYGEGWYRLSEALLAEGQTVRAEVAFRRAKSLFKKNDPDLAWLQARLEVAREEYAQAKTTLLNYGEDLERPLQTNLLLAQCYVGLKDDASASAVYQLLYERYGTEEAVLAGMAGSFFRLEQFEGAEGVYRTLVGQYPTNDQYRYNLAVTQARLGLYEEACSAFERLSAGGNATLAAAADQALREFCR